MSGEFVSPNEIQSKSLGDSDLLTPKENTVSSVSFQNANTSNPIISETEIEKPKDQTIAPQISHDTSTPTTPPQNYHLSIIVSDPQKHRPLPSETDTASHYITYQISTKTDNPKWHTDEGQQDINHIIVVHRRYKDLNLLYNTLINKYATCIVPPVPDKKLLQYVTGDRFSVRFTQRRSHSIQNFLNRIAKHPILKETVIFQMFLISSDWDTYKKSLLNTNTINSSTKDELSDTFMNAFKSVKEESEAIIEVKEKTEKLQNQLNKLEKIWSKIIKKDDSIIEDFSKISGDLENLCEVINEGDPLEKKIRYFNNDGIMKSMYALKDLNKYLDYEYIVDIKDMEQFIEVVRQLIKAKEQKQIDYEELKSYLNKCIDEKNNLISGGNGNTNFITSKIEEISGINVEGNKRDRIDKLEVKIESLGTELEKAKKVSDVFEEELLKEAKMFETFKTQELKTSMNNLADAHIKYYENMLASWEEVDKQLNSC